MALRESGEDYLESIYVLSQRQGIVRSIDVAEYLGVTKASVSKAMATLENNGYVEMGKRDVHLTERGLEVARQMWERHCFSWGCWRMRVFRLRSRRKRAATWSTA